MVRVDAPGVITAVLLAGVLLVDQHVGFGSGGCVHDSGWQVRTAGALALLTGAVTVAGTLRRGRTSALVSLPVVFMMLVSLTVAAFVPCLGFDIGLFVFAAMALGGIWALVRNEVDNQRIAISLARNQAALRQIQESRSSTMLSQRRRIADSVSAELVAILDDVSTADPDVIVERARAAIEMIIRPRCQELVSLRPTVETPPFDGPYPSRLASVTSALGSSDVPPVLLGVTMAGLTARALAGQSLGIADSSRTGLNVVGITVVFVIVAVLAVPARAFVRRVHPRGPIRGLLLNVAVAAIIGWAAVTLLSSPLAAPFGPFPAQVTTWQLFAPPLLIAAFGAALRHSQNARKKQLGALRRETLELRRQSAHFAGQLWMQQTQLAMTLHGPVQAALNAGVIQIQSADDPQAISRDVVSQIRERVVDTCDHMASVDPEDVPLSVSIESIRDTWRGICDFELASLPSVLDLLESDLSAKRALVDILTEAVANSVVHGEASHVWARIDAHEDGVLLLAIRDDGSLRQQSGRQGLGSMLLDELTISWERKVHPDGYEVVAYLPHA